MAKKKIVYNAAPTRAFKATRAYKAFFETFFMTQRVEVHAEYLYEPEKTYP